MLDLESFAFSAPFGLGPIGQYAITGQVTIDPSGYLSWMALGGGMEFALFGTTKLAVYGPAIGSAFFGELGLFTVLGLNAPIIAVSAPVALVAASAVISKSVVDVTESTGGKPHRTSFTGQPSGPFFDY